jgi:ABC-type oligopeptide transport system ATPase subunit
MEKKKPTKKNLKSKKSDIPNKTNSKDKKNKSKKSVNNKSSKGKDVTRHFEFKGKNKKRISKEYKVETSKKNVAENPLRETDDSMRSDESINGVYSKTDLHATQQDFNSQEISYSLKKKNVEKKNILTVSDLTVQFGKENSKFIAVDHVDLEIKEGEILGLVGESGSGKTTIGRTVIGLNEYTTGEIVFDGVKIPKNPDSISGLFNKWLSKNMQMIFQDPTSSLHPTKKIYSILDESYKNNKLSLKDTEQTYDFLISNLEKVIDKIKGAKSIVNYEEISRKIFDRINEFLVRKTISSILKMRGEISFEESMGYTNIYDKIDGIVDVIKNSTKDQIVNVVKSVYKIKVQENYKFISQWNEVIRANKLKLQDLKYIYHRDVSNYVLAKKIKKVSSKSAEQSASRNDEIEKKRTKYLESENNYKSQVRELKKFFEQSKIYSDRFILNLSEIKRAYKKCVANTEILFQDGNIFNEKLLSIISERKNQLRYSFDLFEQRLKNHLALKIEEDQFTTNSFSEQQLEDIIKNPLKFKDEVSGKNDLSKRQISNLLEMVDLDPSYLSKYASQLSGGQQQRVGIARAISVNPKLIIADEPISALDVSIQSGIVNMIKKLSYEKGIAFLFIAHDLRMVRYISNRIAVIYKGRIVESGLSHEVYDSPIHPYTRTLISAVPSINVVGRSLRSEVLSYESHPKNVKLDWYYISETHKVLFTSEEASQCKANFLKIEPSNYKGEA